jgi:thiopurine S-methyltransferase
VAGPIEILQGDAFGVDAAMLAGCGAVFDRAALIALPPPLRERYVRELHARLPQGCRGLLVTLDYPQHEKDGPPFAVAADEVRALYGRDWDVELLEHRDILAQQPRFQAEGVSALHTGVWRLQRR